MAPARGRQGHQARRRGPPRRVLAEVVVGQVQGSQRGEAGGVQHLRDEGARGLVQCVAPEAELLQMGRMRRRALEGLRQGGQAGVAHAVGPQQQVSAEVQPAQVREPGEVALARRGAQPRAHALRELLQAQLRPRAEVVVAQPEAGEAPVAVRDDVLGHEDRQRRRRHEVAHALHARLVVHPARAQLVVAQVEGGVVVAVRLVEEAREVLQTLQRVPGGLRAGDARMPPQVEALLLVERLPHLFVGVEAPVLVQDDALLVQRAAVRRLLEGYVVDDYRARAKGRGRGRSAPHHGVPRGSDSTSGPVSYEGQPSDSALAC